MKHHNFKRTQQRDLSATLDNNKFLDLDPDTDRHQNLIHWSLNYAPPIQKT